MANRERRRESHASKSFQKTDVLTSLPKPKDRHSKTALLLAIPLVFCSLKKQHHTRTHARMHAHTHTHTHTHTKQTKTKQTNKWQNTRQDKTKQNKTKQNTERTHTKNEKEKENHLSKENTAEILFLHIYCMDYQWLGQVFALTHSTHSAEPV